MVGATKVQQFKVLVKLKVNVSYVKNKKKKSESQIGLHLAGSLEGDKTMDS